MQKKQKGLYSNILYLIFFDDMPLHNISEILPNAESPKRLHFIKNEEGEWMPQQLSEEEREEKKQQEEIKERGICIVHTPGHAIWYAAERILEVLSLHHDLPMQVVILSEDNHLPTQGMHNDKILLPGEKYVPLSQRYAPPENATLAWLVQHMNKDMLLEIKKINDDIQYIFQNLNTTPHHSSVNYIPKTQKSKAKFPRKHNQKKK